MYGLTKLEEAIAEVSREARVQEKSASVRPEARPSTSGMTRTHTLQKLANLVRNTPLPELAPELVYQVKTAGVPASLLPEPAAPEFGTGRPAELRKVAHALRTEDVRRHNHQGKQAALVLQAAQGLHILRGKFEEPSR